MSSPSPLVLRFAWLLAVLAAPATLSAQNLISNSGFTTVANWTYSNAYTSVSTPAPPTNYTKSGQVPVVTGSGDGWLMQEIAVTHAPGKRYYARVHARSTAGNLAYIQIKRLNDVYTEVAPRVDSIKVANPNAWQLIEVSADTVSGTTKIQVLLRYVRTPGNTVWFTGAELRLAPTLILEPTFENIGAFIPSPGNESFAQLEYRKPGNSWSQALAPDRYQSENEFRGSVLQLEPATTYEVRVSLKMSSSPTAEVVNRREASVTTWSEDPPPIGAGRDFTLPEGIITIGNGSIPGVYDIGTRVGDANSWYRFKAHPNGTTIDAPSGTNGPAVLINNCEYVIFEGIKVRGGKENGIEVRNSNNIRIRNCDIADWLRWPTISFGPHSNPLYSNTTYGYKYGSDPLALTGWINIKGGIKLRSTTSGSPHQLTGNMTHSIVIENNLIHHPALSAPSWLHGHPTGPDGIELWFVGGQNVIRNNDIVAGAGKRLNDGIASAPNYGTLDTTALAGNGNRNSDIYGNLFLGLNDDGTELDGDQKNLRYWHNWVESAFVGISSAANKKGTSYVFRNVFVDGDEDRRAGTGIKLGGAPGFTWLLHNTFLLRNKGLDGGNMVSEGAISSAFTRNNLVASQPDRQAGFWDLAAGDVAGHFDYDLLPVWGLPASVPNPWETNVIKATPLFVSDGDRDFRLTSNSDGYQDAVVLNQVSGGGTPHMGAIADASQWSAWPPRPAGAAAIVPNRRAVRIRAGQTAGFTLSLVSDTQAWTATGGESWLTVSPASGSASPGAQTLTCTVNAAGVAAGRQLTYVSVRTANGLLRTVPIDIEVDPAQPPTTFVFEAESNLPDTTNFAIVSDASASGGSYARVVNPGSTSDAPLNLVCPVPTTGDYYVHLRARTEGPFASVTNQYTVFLKIDGVLYKQFHNVTADGRFELSSGGSADQNNSWGWHTAKRIQTQGPAGTVKDAGPFVLAAGNRTINVYRRSTNFHLDKVVVSTDPRPPVGFEMSGNQVVMEAENCSTKLNAGGARWDIVTDPDAAFFTNNNAVQSLPNVAVVATPGSSTPRTEYTIHVPAGAATSYYVHVRGKPGPNGGNDDSVNLSIDNNTSTYVQANIFLPAGSMTWKTACAPGTSTVTPLSIGSTSSAGIRTLTMWMREDGFIVDRIVLSTSSTPPIGTGPAESSRK